MPRLFNSCSLGAIGWALFALAMPAIGKDTLPAHISFNEHIRPIFVAHCTGCHGGVKQAGELSFIYPERVLPPEGTVIEPGKPDESAVMERVTSTDTDFRMPPADHGPPLSKREIDLLREWIQQGAKWEKHWAFEPPKPQKLPDVSNKEWSHADFDRFILARLDREGVKPNPEEAADRWLRRVSLDLIGLPPTPEERTAFLTDREKRGEAAYSAVVDRLLASPRFGERWASVWFDQIRYADSRGLGYDKRRNIWKYRDWVIDAFNADLPYDQFTIKQLAGDLLPQGSMEDLVATGCERLTQSNDEGGTDDEEFRVEAVLDRVNTTWQAWQGMTFGCTRCHDHPYEPFKHDDYYKFSAFFNNTRDSDLGEEYPVVQVPLDKDDYSKARELDQKIEALRKSIWKAEYTRVARAEAWQPVREMKAATNNETKVEVETKGDHDEFFTVGTIDDNTDIKLSAQIDSGSGPITAIRFTGMPLDPETAVRDSEWGFVLSHIEASLHSAAGDQKLELAYVIADEPEPFLDPQESLNAKNATGFAAYTRINTPRSAAILLKTPAKVPASAELRVVLKFHEKILSSFPLVARRGHLAVSNDPAFTALLANKKRHELQHELAKLKSQRSKIESTALPVMRELPQALRRPTHVFVRGNYLTKDKEVQADVPGSLPPLPAGATHDRLAMAKWIVSPENPLTARVAVNRYWSRLFGVGLVETEEDFGTSGQPPSHPELLDYLALRFEHELGWSTKKLLRELVLSSTYRQSVKRRPELAERDAANRLLAQGPRGRLSAETVRDQALAISGLLSDKQFGPPVYPPIPAGVWKPFEGRDKWKTPPPGDPDRYRRSIYTYIKRSIPYPVSAAFDAPSRDTCMPRRLQSNTPIQAFMTMNDATFVECDAALAKRMMDHSETLRDQLTYGFLLATCRTASDTELDELEGFVKQLPERQSPTDRMTLAASVLLNLDEVIAK